MRDCLYIVIPAYNEEENIKQVIEDWYPIVEKYNGSGASRLVIIDDGSKDHTYEIMQEYAKDRPYFCPITKPNGGHGATVLYGYHYAIEHGADYVFQTDSDGQTLPEEFHEFWELREQYDMVIGHRNKREDGGSRVFVTKVLKLVVCICFGVSIADVNTPFRLMNTGVLKEEIQYEPKDFNLSNVLLSVLYLMCLVAFASAISNQYFAIPMAALCVFGKKIKYIYMIFISYYLLWNESGLGRAKLYPESIRIPDAGYWSCFIGCLILAIVIVCEIRKSYVSKKANE